MDGEERGPYHLRMDPLRAALRVAAEKGLLPRDGSILLAVSGGADSLALLHAAAGVAPETGWKLTAAHVHHGWRGREADRDLAFVSDHARRLGLTSLFRRVDAGAAARRLKLSPEAAARFLRYGALREMAAEAAALRIATAHQKDDVFESHRIARERRGGVSRLAGPRVLRDDGVVRPLLGVSREEILAFLAARGIAYRRDSSNGRLRLARNRVRRALALERARGESGFEAAAEREIAAMAEERDRLDRAFVGSVLPLLSHGAGVTVADAAWLANTPAELRRRAVEAAALPFAAAGRPPLSGKEREALIERLASGRDFRFEAGRRIRFERRGPVFRVWAVAPPAARV